MKILAIAALLTVFAVPLPAQIEAAGEAPVEIHAYLDEKIGAYKPIYSWFGYDEANYTTTEHGRALLKELHDLSPVPVSIRVHHLLTSGDGKAKLKFSSTNVYSEDANGKARYDFAILDGIFDAYKAAGVRPMVELGFMPRDLAANLPDRHEPYEVEFPKSAISGASNNPPKDYAKWEELVRAVTAHLVERYGRDAVLQWYFEVWNEPDIDYWHSTPEEYWKLYDYAVAGVREALPGARVGGPATTSPGNERANLYLNNFLEHVNSGKSAATGGAVPLDFISFHAKGAPKVEDGVVTMGLNRELTDADKGFATVAGFARFRHLPIILSEADPEGCAACSSKMNPANNYRNGTLYPAYTAVALKGLFGLADRHGVNLISMLSWSFEFEGRDYFEGFRSLATNGVDKPVLNVFRMFGMMSGERVKTESTGAVGLDTLVTTGVRGRPDVDAMATSRDGEAAVLLWNYQDRNDADGRALAKPVVVTVSGVPKGVKRVLVEQYRIDERHSNAYAAWLKMGSPQQPSAEQYAELKRAGTLALVDSPAWVEVGDDGGAGRSVAISMELPGESVGLVRLTWAR